MVDLPKDHAAIPLEPAGEEEQWVSLAEAAAITHCAERWLMDRCRDGRLPSRPSAGAGLVVPLTTVHALVSGRISE